MFFRELLNITHEYRSPGTTRLIRPPVLYLAALCTPQHYTETEFAWITKTFGNFEYFSDHHVLGRMDISRFQTVTCGDIRIALYPQYFSSTSSNLPWQMLQFNRTLKAPHSVASIIFALWCTWRKNVSFSRFAIVDEFEHISGHDEENCGPDCGCQLQALISLTQTKNQWNPSMDGDERDRRFCHRLGQGLLWTHNLNVWDPKSVVMPQFGSTVFQSENNDLLNVLGTGARSVTVQIGTTWSFWMKTLPPYMEVLFWYENGSPDPTRRVQKDYR